MQETEPQLSNATLSHYRIVSKIGEGGVGEVYLAEDIKLDHKVALKILRSHRLCRDSQSLGSRLRGRFVEQFRVAYRPLRALGADLRFFDHRFKFLNCLSHRSEPGYHAEFTGLGEVLFYW